MEGRLDRLSTRINRLQLHFPPTFPNTHQGTLGIPSVYKDSCIGTNMANGGIQGKEDLSCEFQGKIAKFDTLKFTNEQSASDFLSSCELNDSLQHNDNVFIESVHN